MKRAAPSLAFLALLAGCGAEQEPAPSPTASETQAPAPAPLQVEDFPALASKECVDVVQFYLEAIGGHEWVQAALVWNDPAVDAARLEAVFGGYGEPQVEWTDPFVEGAAGSLFCSVAGKLTDAQDPAKPLTEGTLLLRRVNDVPGATPDQLRWTLLSSTFVERLERGQGGEP
ncbi:MAG TPA: hypothetical protein VK001_10455 [Geminicoccaceae bacterium]|nr:hypothetical protein [Geminicoccaceae bacterium]